VKKQSASPCRLLLAPCRLLSPSPTLLLLANYSNECAYANNLHRSTHTFIHIHTPLFILISRIFSMHTTCAPTVSYSEFTVFCQNSVSTQLIWLVLLIMLSWIIKIILEQLAWWPFCYISVVCFFGSLYLWRFWNLYQCVNVGGCCSSCLLGGVLAS
jgi:hypothetical protein